MTKRKDDNNNPNFVRITMPIDPSMKKYLPPEIVALIQRDMLYNGGGAGQESEEEEKLTVAKEKVQFDFKMVNCDTDLKTLTQKLKKSKIRNYGILLYGVSGAGKSQWAKALAQELKMPVIKKLASDIHQKFVGETEQNIRKAFKEARDKKAVLVFDEADSFLTTRDMAQQSFQITCVNEVLVQMEDHPYPFIMTTNLKDKIDNAAFRRFIFKIKYDYMTPENIQAGLKTYFGKGFKFTEEQLSKLKYICPGDFKLVKSKLDILENGKYTTENVFEYLLKEQEEKNVDKGSKGINI